MVFDRLLALARHADAGPEREPPTIVRGPGRFAEWMVIAAGVLCVLGLAQRFRYGTELSDETFSIAMPYRYVLGDKPFVDEISVQQTAGILLYPFVWLFVKITGGSSGLVLYVRGVHLFVKAIAGLCVYQAARRLLAYRSSAIAVAFVTFAFVPHSIPNVGYNVLGMSLLAAGSFLAAAAVAQPTPERNLLFYAGLCHGLCAFAYPPMAVGPILATPLVLFCAPEKRFRALGAYVLGGAFAVLLVLPALAFGGIKGIKWGLSFGHDTPPGRERVKAIAEAWWNGVPEYYRYFAGALVLARVFKSKVAVAILVPIFTILLLLLFKEQSHGSAGPLTTVTYVGTFAPVLLVVARPDAKLLRASVLVLVPSFACGLAAGVFSTQNATAISLGVWSSVILLALLAARSLEQAWAERFYCAIPSIAIMYVLVSQSYDYVYRDGPIATLTTKVTSGPFRGIYTTTDRASMFSELSQITRTFDKPGGHVMMLYDQPGLYLFSKNRPSARCVWEVSWYGGDTLYEFWRRKVNGKGYVVYAKNSGHGAYLDPLVAVPERKLMETPHFIVYGEPSPSP